MDKKEETEVKEEEKKSGRLPEEVISYFKRVEQVLLEDSFEDDSHKEAFIKNVFHEVEKDGMQLGRHPITSRVLEQIIPLLSPKQYEIVTTLIEEDAEMLCCDRFASHVVELFCKEISRHLNESNVIDIYLGFCKNIRKHVDIFLRDTYGSHVLSTLLQTLSGVTVPEVITKSKISRESKKVKKKKGKKTQQFQNTITLKDSVTTSEVPELFTKMYKKFLKTIKDDDNFGELLCHRTASPVLQVLVITLQKVSSEKFASMTQLIVNKARIEMSDHQSGNEEEEEDEETMHKLPVVLTDQVGSHLFEVLLQTADADTFENLTTRCMLRMVVSLSIHPIANFLVQTMLRSMDDKGKAKYFVMKLTKFTEDILAAGHMGCIVRVAEVIARLEMKEHQKQFIDVLVQALHIPEGDSKTELSLAKLILSLMTYDVFFKLEETSTEDKITTDEKPATKEIFKNEMINYHGACLLKSCLAFEKCDVLMRSFSSLTTDELTVVACHPSGNFAFESFLKNKNIKRKHKNSLSDKLAGKFAILACDKFGSRVIDALWGSVGQESKNTIKTELTKSKAKLESDLYGRIVLCNCEINQHAKKMREIKEKQEKKRKMFEDILTEPKIHEPAQPPPKKTKNKNDRAAKYREQLKALGISFDEENEAASVT